VPIKRRVENHRRARSQRPRADDERHGKLGIDQRIRTRSASRKTRDAERHADKQPTTHAVTTQAMRVRRRRRANISAKLVCAQPMKTPLSL
jgi:hypothetical protein